MRKEVFHLGATSDNIQRRKAPLSAVTGGAGLVFVSGLPPFDIQTDELVRGDIKVQTRQCLEVLKYALDTEMECIALA